MADPQDPLELASFHTVLIESRHESGIEANLSGVQLCADSGLLGLQILEGANKPKSGLLIPCIWALLDLR